MCKYFIFILCIFISLTPCTFADSCNDLLLTSKDPKLEEGILKLREYVNTYSNDVSWRLEIKHAQKTRPYIDQILNSSRPQDIPLDILDRIAHADLKVGTGESLTSTLQKLAALKLLEKQKLPQAEKEIERIQNEIAEARSIIDKRTLDRNRTQAHWSAIELAQINYNLVVLKHIFYTSPELLTPGLLLFMVNVVQTPMMNQMRDAYYLWNRLNQTLRQQGINPEGYGTPSTSGVPPGHSVQ